MQFTREQLRNNQQIIIYGASVYGELALRGLEKIGLKPTCFADRASCGKEYLGYQVISPEDLREHVKDCILIASADFYYEILNYLESIECEYIYDISYLLELKLDIHNLSNRAKEMFYAKENYCRAAKGTDLTIIHLGFCVSERCSLKCRDCSFLMQYYESPQNIDLVYYKSALDRFLDAVDFISEFRIYGGEPFMNPDMYKLIEWYRDCKKINTISIYTNGTIIPDVHTLQCMKHKKVKVHISDYKHNSDRIDKLVPILQKENISYFIRRYDLWQQAGDLELKNHTKEQIEKIYSKCFAVNCYSFLKGKFYVCPRAAHAVNLGAMKESLNDMVDFNNSSKKREELQQELRVLMHEKKFIEACKYCDGLDNHIEGVTPAIQVKNSMPYKKILGEI